ncbi:hypothetical protein [Arboricoccus pini]|nr:hypothetical protein [Arboricoccus pini]
MALRRIATKAATINRTGRAHQPVRKTALASPDLPLSLIPESLCRTF